MDHGAKINPHPIFDTQEKISLYNCMYFIDLPWHDLWVMKSFILKYNIELEVWLKQ
jgi:hypothetical protein